MNNYKKLNNITGWIVFVVALTVYLTTAAPVADWWDCMEFTATSYKLEIGHPPGAPLFMMMMRVFTMFASSPETVGFWGNVMSCVMSALTILFMFWTISRLAQKLGADGLTALASALVGSLAYAFTDTFWFSAVESEVYATSSMFTALVVWLMMRWEEVADEEGNERWLVLIAYVMGLSIGVHILNLLTVPALVFVYYFRKATRITWQGVAGAVVAAGGILFAIYKVIMPLTVSMGAGIDRIAVNDLGWPVNSGMALWLAILFTAVFAGIFATRRSGKRLWNTVLLCTAVILIGYSSYASVVIRSSVNPPMNSNRPDNPYALQELMGRTQYGRIPIVYGPMFDSEMVDMDYGYRWEMGEDGKYHRRRFIRDYVYGSGEQVAFPRLWDFNDENNYRAWLGLDKDESPTYGDNLSYFFGHQFNFMFWRYFMWNFVGRQDDVQGRGDIIHGNWLSGIKPIDALYLGPQSDLPSEIANNKGRNTFFFLPFLLGILGLIYQLSKDKRGFTVVMWLFVMMGVALVVYFNVLPTAVRERDYIYAGAFYAFSIWIGLGVTWVKEIITNRLRAREFSTLIATVVCLSVPLVLLSEGWDDHDRSGRRIGHDFGYNFLVSTLPDAIIMNFGDNDTFPLWYNQEVEDVRPDVRIMNMSYAGANWYIEQMRHAYNNSEPVPMSISMDAYADNDLTYVEPLVDYALDVRTVVDFVSDRHTDTRWQLESGGWIDYIPSDDITIPVDKQNAIDAGIVRAEDAHLMVDSIRFTIPTTTVRKDQLLVLDVLANFDWSRPIYTTAPQIFTDLGLGEWLQADGWAYRLVPIRTPAKAETGEYGRIDTELTYDLLMNRYKYGNASNPRVYVDYTSLVNLRWVQARETFVRLANELLEQGDVERAVEVLDRCLTEYPPSKFDYDFWPTYSIIEAYYGAGAMERGDVLLEDYANVLQEYIKYYGRFGGSKFRSVETVWMDYVKYLGALETVAEFYGRTAQKTPITDYLDGLVE